VDLDVSANAIPNSNVIAKPASDLSWAAYQYETLGYVTISMVIVLILHTIYAVDFFYNEDWYTRTIDITHDHFGFMLTWGDSTFLPAFYTLQAQYLARYPAHLTTLQSIAVLALGLIGYGIFRLANHEKDYVRSHNGNVLLWGQPATFVSCTYRTSDGKEHKSILLTSGMWGLCRHSNYMGDLIISFAMCAACGVKHLLPWSYFFYMLILLCNRISRDEERCSNKYGEKWAEYCDKVRFRLIPGVY
jgi:7-dehydrocholesterol reductase